MQYKHVIGAGGGTRTEKVNFSKSNTQSLPTNYPERTASLLTDANRIRRFRAFVKHSAFRTLYYQKTRLTLKKCGSRGFPIVVVQHSAEFFSALDVAHFGQGRRRFDQFVLDSLRIAPMAIIVGEGREGGPEMLLA